MPSCATNYAYDGIICKNTFYLGGNMTISEEITSLISQKYFLKQYIFDNLLVKEDG